MPAPGVNTERIFAIAQMLQNLMGLHQTLRDNLRVIQASAHAGTLAVPVQQAVRDLGKACQQRLAMNETVASKHPGALRIDPADLAALHAFVKGYADALATTAATDAAGVDQHVTAITADVPAVASAFV